MSDMEFFAGVFDDCDTDAKLLLKYAAFMISVARSVDAEVSKDEIAYAIQLGTLEMLKQTEKLEKVRLYIVTLKVDEAENHDPLNKVKGGCRFHETCTDTTGAHHTIVVPSQADVSLLYKYYHVTRVEIQEGF